MDHIFMGTPLDELFEEGFMTTPLDVYSGEKSPNLSEDDLNGLVKLLEEYKEQSTLADLVHSNFMYWSTYALYSAVQLQNAQAAQRIGVMIQQISKTDPDVSISMFGKTFKEDKFKGQNVAYAWMDILYSSTFDAKNSTVILVIYFIFTTLLETAGTAISALFARNNNEGKEKGKNAVLVSTRALAHAAEISDNQSTEIIAELLQKFIDQSPDVIGSALSQEFTQGSFKGKSSVYVLAGALKSTSVDNPNAVKMIANILLRANSNSLIESLCKVHSVGPYKGMCALHIIATGLVSAAYINRNSAAIHSLMHLLEQLRKGDGKDKIDLALSETILDGEQRGLNGIMMIVRALIAAMDHELDTSTITDFLSDFIMSDPKELGEVFINQALKSTITDYTISPLMHLIKKLQNSEDPEITANLSKIIHLLAGSKSALVMLISLPTEHRNIFVNALAKVYSLNTAERDFLNNADCEELEARPPSFFLDKSKKRPGDKLRFFAELTSSCQCSDSIAGDEIPNGVISRKVH